MNETDILHEAGRFWVLKDSYKGQPSFTVMENGLTHSQSVDDVTYPDVSLAIVRCNYLAKVRK